MTMGESSSIPVSEPAFDVVCSSRTRMLARVDNASTLALWISIVTSIIAVFVSVKLLAVTMAMLTVAVILKQWNYPRFRAGFLSDALAAGMPKKAARQLWFETMEE
jgi:hypothetical protein